MKLKEVVNGNDFSEIGTVAATSQSKASYSYVDNTMNLSGVVYYRLKILDKDGAFAYSDIKSLQLENIGFAVTLYPNPVHSSTKLNVALDQAQVIKVSVNDALGKCLKQFEISGQKGSQEKILDLSTIPIGSYMIRIQAGPNSKTLSIIKN